MYPSSLSFVMHAVEVNEARRHAEFVNIANAAAACASAGIGKPFGRRAAMLADRLPQDVATFAEKATTRKSAAAVAPADLLAKIRR